MSLFKSQGRIVYADLGIGFLQFAFNKNQL